MKDAPISNLLNGIRSDHVHDVALLVFLMSVQEKSGIISPWLEDGRMRFFDGMTEEQCRESFKRLVDCGELKRVETETSRGFVVVRFEDWQKTLADFGRRLYFRAVSKSNREKGGQQ